MTGEPQAVAAAAPKSDAGILRLFGVRQLAAAFREAACCRGKLGFAPKQASVPQSGSSKLPHSKGFDAETRALQSPLPIRFLAALIVAYALLAGCYTLRNFDLGWQLAAGRYIVQTGHTPRQDVFSFTAAGREFVYPAGSELLFYALYRAAGYPALVLLGALVCATVVLLVLWGIREAFDREQGSYPTALLTLALLVLAVPVIASRSSPRADVFTLLLFTFCLVLLSRFHRGLSDRLYLLPLLFAGWANLHQGFLFGLLLFLPFAVALLLAARDPGVVREPAVSRLKKLAVWAAASALAVLANPWGWKLYASLAGVGRDMSFQQGLIGEASPLPIGLWRLGEAFRLDDPDAGIWLLALLAVIAFAIAAWRGQIAPALLLAGGLLLGARYVRAQALFAVVACVVLPQVFSQLRTGARGRSGIQERDGSAAPGVLWRTAGVIVIFVLLLGGVAVRCRSLVSGRYYAWRADTANFGFGASWWFPERALDFVLRERLPGNVYHDYNLGGWVMWRLYPAYKVYIDGRAQPFTPEVFEEQQSLVASAPGSDTWQEVLERRGINTVIVSLARYGGYRVSPSALCASSQFRLVYMDETAGVWLRVTPANQAWLDRLARSCEQALPLPAGRALAGVATGAPDARAVAAHSRAERYNALANEAQLYAVLGHDTEAVEAWEQAEKLYPGEPNLRLAIAQYLAAHGKAEEARHQYLLSLAARDSGPAWHWLGLLDGGQQRFAEAAEDFRRAAQRSVLPHESYRMLGETLLALRQPEEAMAAFGKARSTSHYRDVSREPARTFMLGVADGERRAREMLRK